MAKRPAKATTIDPTLDAIGITSLAKSGKVDSQRDLLQPGLHQVDLAIKGKIDGQTWSRAIAGSLLISPDTTAAASSTPWADLLQSALCLVTAAERQRWLAQVSEGNVPEPSCGQDKAQAVAAEIEPALKSYRGTKTATKRGPVTFVPASKA